MLSISILILCSLMQVDCYICLLWINPSQVNQPHTATCSLPLLWDGRENRKGKKEKTCGLR